MCSSKMTAYGRSLFETGDYVQYFRPEESGGPFTALYRQKRNDILSLVQGNDLDILDVGGGPGRMAAPLAERNRVVLCDISVDMLKNASNDGAVDFSRVVADAHNLPLGDAQFDYVLAIDLLVHLQDPRRAIAEFTRLLRPHGKLIVDSTNSNPLWTLFYPWYVGKNPARWTKVLLGGGVLPEWQKIVRHYRQAEFRRMLTTAGFVILRQFTYGPAICPKWTMALAMKVNAD
ncbi:MAG: methyltransferase domain-containing protein [Chloroflexi bacterium]|nr:methyltransferase domain-containing protein [Chloroflexota bacterium]